MAIKVLVVDDLFDIRMLVGHLIKSFGLEVEFAGKLAKHKLEGLGKTIKTKNGDYFLSNDTTSIAWALNIRGNDISHIPVALSFALFSSDGRGKFFVDEGKLSIETRTI